jgi:DNA-binding XRE family transcriptional regulator
VKKTGMSKNEKELTKTLDAFVKHAKGQKVKGIITETHKKKRELPQLLGKGISVNLRELRSKRGWNQVRAAKECEIAYRTFCSFDNGEKLPGSESLTNLCKGFGVSRNRIYRGVE